MNAKPMLRTLTASALGLCLMIPTVGAAQQPEVRTFKMNVTLDGKQNWKKEPQFYDATSQQSFQLSTQLQSNGKLYAPNLLHTDTNTRLAIKTEYLRMQGLKKIEAAGIDPNSPSLQQDLSRGMQKASFDCKGDIVCMGRVNNHYAMMMAAAVEPDNSQLFEGEPRYLYFEPFSGCENSIQASIRIDAEGETTYGDKEETWPFTQTMEGSTQGNKNEQESLCDFFLVVVDTLDDKMFVENVYFPGMKGKVQRTEFEKTHSLDEEIPMAAGLQDWVNQTLRGPVALEGQDSAKLSLTLPLDGDATVLGKFTGVGKTELEWSFK